MLRLSRCSLQGQASRDGFAVRQSPLPADGNCSAYTSPNAVQMALQLPFHKEQASGPYCTSMLTKPNTRFPWREV